MDTASVSVSARARSCQPSNKYQQSAAKACFITRCGRLQVLIFLRQRLRGGSGHVGLVLLHECRIDGNLRRSQGRRRDKLQVGVSGQLTREPQEGLLKVVIGLGRDIVVLQVLFAMESDGLGLDLAFLDIDLVSAQNDRNVFADANQVTVPVGYVLVRNSRSHIKHNNGTLSVDVVAVAQTTKFLLAGRVPRVKTNRAKVGVEKQRVHLDTQRGYRTLKSY